MREKRFCPKCKSENIEWQGGVAPGMPGNWLCSKCGHYNVVFPVKEMEKKK